MSEPSGRYDPKSVEAEIYEFWEAGGRFHADPDPDRRPFTIVIPPPNVTGALHLGHALNNTLQDILIRSKRMQGFNACWLPGTDHAGIATQAVVETRLRQEEGLTRHQIGRDGLVERIWKWKEDYNNRIINQLRKMGCSCDWRRTRFTLDDVCARAVYETFFRLFKAGLIFRGQRLVNWDCELQTAVADDELYHDTVRGHLWHIRYPIIGRHEGTQARRHEGECGRPARNVAAGASPAVDVQAVIARSTRPDARPGVDYLVVATTRPETMLGDTAVAVHPSDERYRHLIGGQCLLPLMNRAIPIIADGLLVDPAFGTGCVKVTPGHDPNDYECAVRNNLEKRNILTLDGKINENGRSVAADAPVGRADQRRDREGAGSGEQGAENRDRGIKGSRDQGEGGVSDEPDPSDPRTFDYVGLDRFAARKQAVADLESLGLLERIEPYQTDIGHSERSKTPIEPLLSEQWFVKMDKLAEMAMEAVRDGRVRIVPERYAKTYLDWLGEKRDWCISRQLWWGHRIPVWRFPTGFRFLPQDQANAVNALRWAIDNGLVAVASGPESRDLAAVDPALALDPSTLAGSSPAILKDYYCPHPDFFKEFEPIAHNLQLVQEDDVLDTWFSSALWPFSTFGWPDQSRDRKGAVNAPPAPGRTGRPGAEPLAHARGSDLDYFFPTDVLITNRDIISLWVARMVMTSLYLTGRVPFQHVYIHPTIQDGEGRRMSKSLGNGVDPLDLFDHYGTDATRFVLTSMAGLTQDIRIPVEYLCPHCGQLTPQQAKHLKQPIVECGQCGKSFATRLADDQAIKQHGLGLSLSDRFEEGQKFCNKLWQAATGFVLPNVARSDEGAAGFSPRGASTTIGPRPLTRDDLALEDRWILSRLSACIAERDRRLERYQFSDMAAALYAFFWNDFCDWYVELVKPRLYEGERRRPAGDVAHEERAAGFSPRGATSAANSAAVARQVLAWVLDQTLRLLHPITPFITERIWRDLNAVAPRRGVRDVRTIDQPLVIADWPQAVAEDRDPAAEREMRRTQDVIRALREIRTTVNNMRSQAGQKALRRLPHALVRADEAIAAQLQSHLPMIQRLGRCEKVEIGSDLAKPPQSAGKVLTGADVYVPLEGLADPAAERQRLTKELQTVRRGIEQIERKLASENFVKRAPAEVVQRERERLAELQQKRARNEQNLRDLE